MHYLFSLPDLGIAYLELVEIVLTPTLALLASCYMVWIFDLLTDSDFYFFLLVAGNCKRLAQTDGLFHPLVRLG